MTVAQPRTPATSVRLESIEAEGRQVLYEHEVYAVLAGEGIEVPAHRLVRESREVDAELCQSLRAAEAVVKVVSPDILHKSDVGGVAICANRIEALRDTLSRVLSEAAARRPEAAMAGALVVERVPFEPGLGRELLVGFRHDPAFGPIVVLGVGGLDTEYLLGALRPERARAVLRSDGLTEGRVLEALRRTVVHAALCGGLRSRHGAELDEAALVRLVLRLARLAERHAGFAPSGGLGLSELEVNPVVASADGRLVALDGLARLHRPRPLAPPRRVEDLNHLLRPRSAAVIGASAHETNVGRVILDNLEQGGGVPKDRLWAVHRSASHIGGCRAFPSVRSLPEPVDLAVVALAADKGAGEVVHELVETRRARSVMLIAGGFGETQAGRAAEARLRAAIERSHRDPDGGVLVNGGNCLGIISVPGGYNAFFIPPYKLPFNDAPGQNVASISQSGAYLVTQISNLDRAVRPRYAISFGNQIDVSVGDYLEHLAGDPQVAVFAVYLEGFRPGDGARFLDVAERLARGGRTVLLYKAGRSPQGGAAAASHTASAVGDYEVCRELARAAGVLECQTLNMFEDYLVTFSFLAGRPVTGRRIAVLSNAGFECAAAADKLYGLELAPLAPRTLAQVAELLPAGLIDVHNPVDATPMTSTERYAGVVSALLRDPGVDALVVAGVPATPALEDLARGPGHAEDIARETSLPSRLVRIFRSTRKPMVFSLDSGALYEPCVRMMMRAGLPCFRKVDRATRALAAFLGSYR
jgi:acyl-CoA synthetase (NDP forming)